MSMMTDLREVLERMQYIINDVEDGRCQLDADIAKSAELRRLCREYIETWDNLFI